ncbi:IS3 family transposase [Peribacillus butanolivorans]|uniref:IS3 family transposase n=1 Tax=Peribacillus butanolivorans TaxID=421767 RepID=UPI003829B62F
MTEVLRNSKKHPLSNPLNLRIKTRTGKQRTTKGAYLIYRKNKGFYGVPMIHETLSTKWFPISLKRVQRLMYNSKIRSNKENTVPV